MALELFKYINYIQILIIFKCGYESIFVICQNSDLILLKYFLKLF